MGSLTYLDLSGNPWTCDCNNYFIRNILINILTNNSINNSNNNSINIPVVRCWNPPIMRDTDIATIDNRCGTVQSTHRSIAIIDNTSLIAAMVVIAVVIAILILLIKYRLSLRYCIKTEDKTVPSHKVLQYTTYPEPRYVQTQYTVQYPRTYQYSGVSTGGTTTNTGQYRINNQHMYCSDPSNNYQPHSEEIYQTVNSTISEI